MIKPSEEVDSLHYVLTSNLDVDDNGLITLTIPVKEKKDYSYLEEGLLRHALESVESFSRQYKTRPKQTLNDGNLAIVLNIGKENKKRTVGKMQEDLKTKIYESQTNYLFNRFGLRIDISSFTSTDNTIPPGCLEDVVEEAPAIEKSLVKRESKETTSLLEKLEEFYSKLPAKSQPKYRELEAKIDLEKLSKKLKFRGKIPAYNMAIIATLFDSKKEEVLSSDLIKSVKTDLKSIIGWKKSSNINLYHTLKTLSDSDFIKRSGSPGNYAYSLNKSSMPLLEKIVKQAIVKTSSRKTNQEKAYDEKLEGIYAAIPEYKKLETNIDLKRILKETNSTFNYGLETIAVVSALVSSDNLTRSQIDNNIKTDLKIAGRNMNKKSLRRTTNKVLKRLYETGFIDRESTQPGRIKPTYRYSLTEKVYYQSKD